MDVVESDLMPAKATLKLVSPSNENATMPVRPANAILRTREYLEPKEIDRLIAAAKRSGKTSAQAQRNAVLILIAYRHGLRAAEIAMLEWSQVSPGRNAVLHVRRVKNGTPSVHPLQGDSSARCANSIADGRIVIMCSPLSAADPSRRRRSTG
jgi:type 1 fimbriae regulatory protein FimB/type 1 fimbriae regulatory protein FimE